MLKKASILFLSFLTVHSWADHPTVGLQSGNAAPITTSSAFTLNDSQLIVSIDNQYLNLKPVTENQLIEFGKRGEDAHSAESITRTSFSLAWGLSDKLTVGLSLPYIQRENLLETSHHEEEGDSHDDHEEERHADEEIASSGIIEHLGDVSGIGDLQLYGQYEISSDPTKGQALALLFGIKAPTGNTDEKSDEGERLETELQPGSGSWDVFIGMAYSRQLGNISLDSNILYTHVSEGAQGTDLGDIVNYNLSFSYLLGNGGDDGHDHHHLKTEAVFEINGEWRDRTEIPGGVEKHSGGNILYFSPGLRLSLDQWSLSGSVGVPIENFNGVQSEPEIRAVVRLNYQL